MDTIQASSKTSRLFNFGSALFAFCLWGGWAYYINHGEDAHSGLVSGITQGVASFTITLVMVYAITWLYRRMQTLSLRSILPALITICITGTCLYVAHTLVGTPNILLTIAPALSVGFVFCLLTNIKLNRMSKQPVTV